MWEVCDTSSWKDGTQGVSCSLQRKPRVCRKDSRKSFFLKGDDFFLNLTGGITPALFGGTYTEKGGGEMGFSHYQKD